MSSFTESKSNIVAYKGKWATTKNFRYYLSDDLEGEHIEVPAGFIFNGCSIPKIFCFIGCPIEPDTISSSCLHDYLYQTQQYSLYETDLIFLDALRVEGCPPIKRALLYLGVKIGGWIVRLKYKLAKS